jgi:type III restriction enzyme
LTEEFSPKGLYKKPVMMVLCEETSIASLVNEHFQHIVNAYNVPYNSKKVMEFTPISKKKSLKKQGSD